MIELLASLLPAEGLVLELASGDHSFAFAERFPHLIWQPTARDPDAVASLAARQANISNMLRPLELDVTLDSWPVTQADFITYIGLVHDVPLDAMFAGVARALPANAILLITGALRFHGKFTSPATAALPGVRDIRELTAAGTRANLALERTIALPDDQHALVFRRRF